MGVTSNVLSKKNHCTVEKGMGFSMLYFEAQVYKLHANCNIIVL